MKNIYTSYKEAKTAVKKLGFKSLTEYRALYKEDPKLPDNPYTFYKDKGWKDWHDFFGTARPIEPYYSLDEAKQALQKLSITSLFRYKKGYKEDPRLPSEPREFYKDKGWISWFDFLGFARPIEPYYSLDEAKQAVERLAITSEPQYKQFHKEDPRLPSEPGEFYKDKGWVSWFDFCGNKDLDKNSNLY